VALASRDAVLPAYAFQAVGVNFAISSVTWLSRHRRPRVSSLLESRAAEDIFMPGDRNKELRNIAVADAHFARNRIQPAVDAVESAAGWALHAMRT
jgi:hypothetical protein